MSAAERRIEDDAAWPAAVAELAEAALRRLMIWLPMPAPAIGSSPMLLDVLRGFVTAGRQREVAWLFAEAEGIARTHGALVALAQRLPSLLPLRQADPDFAPPAAHGFLANDAGGVLLLDSGERATGTLCHVGKRARPLIGRFEDAWQRAWPLAELRALGL